MDAVLGTMAGRARTLQDHRTNDTVTDKERSFMIERTEEYERSSNHDLDALVKTRTRVLVKHHLLEKL